MSAPLSSERLTEIRDILRNEPRKISELAYKVRCGVEHEERVAAYDDLQRRVNKVQHAVPELLDEIDRLAAGAETFVWPSFSDWVQGERGDSAMGAIKFGEHPADSQRALELAWQDARATKPQEKPNG